MGTILVCAVLLLIVSAVIFTIVRDKKRGKLPGCGCGCASCPKAGSCHKRHS